MANRRITTNSSAIPDLIRLYKHQLGMSKLKPNELCVMVTDSAFNPIYADACISAAIDVGAEVYKTTLPQEGPLPGLYLDWHLRELRCGGCHGRRLFEWTGGAWRCTRCGHVRGDQSPPRALDGYGSGGAGDYSG